jgi:hypothetical protein
MLVCCIAAVVLHLVDYYNIIIAVRTDIINIYDTTAGQTHIVHYTEWFTKSVHLTLPLPHIRLSLNYRKDVNDLYKNKKVKFE